MDFTTVNYMPAEPPLMRLDDGPNDTCMSQSNHGQRLGPIDMNQPNHEQRPVSQPISASQHDPGRRESSSTFPQHLHVLQQPPSDLGPLPSPDDFDGMFRMSPNLGNAIETMAPMGIPSPPPSAHAHPIERRALLNLFGAAGTEHPFQNYWSDTGGLNEVVASLPPKAEADALIQRFFDAVDPRYPIIPRDAFVADVESFWLLPDEAKHKYDPAQVALQFAVYACAMHDTSLQEGQEAQLNTATFYLSCCHQSLCISNYFNRCSLLTVQTLILVCHFLIAGNRVADAWSISGIVQRQIYGLKLNRSPEGSGLNVDGDANDDTFQVRLRLWQAAMSQDTLLSVYLSKPSSTTHFDVNPDYIRALSAAPPGSASSDAAYVRAMWQCSTLIQETICKPRSLKQPLAIDPNHRGHLVARFRQVHAAFEVPFCQPPSSTRWETLPPRLVLQMATLASSYFHALVLLFIEKNDKTGLHNDLRAAIQAAHEGMAAFFALVRLAPGHVRTWTAVHNRTYAMAVSNCTFFLYLLSVLSFIWLAFLSSVFYTALTTTSITGCDGRNVDTEWQEQWRTCCCRRRRATYGGQK